MQLLSTDDIAIITEALIDGTPSRLLLNIARQGGRHEYQLASELMRWLPSHLPEYYGRDWIAALLDWSRVRGDIERDKRGRFTCLPPYLVGEVVNDSRSSLTLCGDPRIASRINREMRHLGVSVAEQVAHGYSSDEQSSEGEKTVVPLGVERIVHTRAGLRGPIESAFDRLGVTILRPTAFAAALPLLDLWIPPSAEQYPRLIGIWERYDPTIASDNRWTGASAWAALPPGLVRCRPSEDWQGERTARVFYHHGDGHVVELGNESGSLWQLYLDREVGHPRTCWRDGSILRVPDILPSHVLQWLRLLTASGVSARFQRGWFVAPLTETTIEHAISVLAAKYQLRQQTGLPPGTPGFQQVRRQQNADRG